MNEFGEISHDELESAGQVAFAEAVTQLEQAGAGLEEDMELLAEPKPTGSMDQGYRHD